MMSLLEFEMFKQIRPLDVLDYVDQRKVTTEVDAFIERFNMFSRWVATEILLTSNLKKRVTVLRRFLQIAKVGVSFLL